MPTKVTDPALLDLLNGTPAAGPVFGPPTLPKEAAPKNPYDIKTDQRDFSVDRTDKGKDYLLKLSGDYNADPSVKTYRTAIGQFAQALGTGVGAQADLALTYAFAKAMDPESVVRDQEQGMVIDSQPWFLASVEKAKKEFGFDEAGGFTPETREKLRKQISNSVAQRAKVYDARRHYYEDQAAALGVDPTVVLGQHDAEPFVPQIQDWVKRVNGEDGVSSDGPPPAFEYMGYNDEEGLTGRLSAEGETEEQRLARELAERRAETLDQSDASRLMRQGVTIGLSDEVAGVGTAIGRALTGDFNLAKNYRVGRDADRILDARARANLGGWGTGIEVVSGGGGIRNVAGAAGSLLRQGAGIGALGGFGYGEGPVGTAINTAGGALVGAGIGLAGQKIAGALGSRAAASDLPSRAALLDEAGRAENVTVNRAMVDPQSNNRVTGVDATITGGRKIQREMSAIEGQIEGRVTDLGNGGQVIDRIALGDKVRGAGERFIEKSGAKAKVKYDRAERLAGDAKVTPKESLRRVDEMIGQYGGAKDTGLLDANGNAIVRQQDGSGLSETANVNSAELAFLKEIKADLSNDLSVGGLRRMRTKLRKKISKGDLVFGEDEARVLSIMDGAADDIRTGLTSQGKAEAANAFDAADKSYRARMEYITGTVQKMLGKRNANASAEQIAGKFNSMVKGDARGLRKFYATLAPDEAADVAATFADQLGTNAKDGFTVAQFMRQTGSKNMSEEALRILFGPEGAKSVKNLRVLGREVERVTGAMNSRTSKSGVAVTYKDWLINALLGATAGGGAMAGGGTAAIAAGGGVIGANALRNALSARALMSTRLTKWLVDAPRTANPRAIDRHFDQLQAIAKAEPAIAGEIDALRNAIMSAANDNVVLGRAAASDEEGQEQ